MWHGTDQRPEVVFSAEEALAMDRWLADERGRSLSELMAVAGARLAAVVRERLADGGRERVVALVGPGNNGGDALVARDLLADEVPVEVWRPLAGDRAPALDGGVMLVDGLFGVGLTRPIEGPAREAVQLAVDAPVEVLAVDVPSGLSATTGEVLSAPGRPGLVLRADHTLTFVGPKAGFFVGAGPRCVGRWRAVDIGFPVEEAEAWVRARRAAAGPSP